MLAEPPSPHVDAARGLLRRGRGRRRRRRARLVTGSLRCNDVFEFEDSLLVIPRHEPRLFLLNPTARMIWEELARGVPPDDVAAGLSTRFGVPPSLVHADMAAILAEWRAHKLLADAPPAAVAVPAQGAPAVAADPSRSFHAEQIYRLCGRPIRLRFEEPAIEGAIHPPLAHTVDPSSHPGDSVDVLREGEGYLVVCNGSDIERAATLEEALGQVFGRILELSYPDAEWLAMMHAAAVGDESGALVMAGDSGSGKSTLTAALIDAGLSYFSDDIVPLDAARRIRPMPLGISVKEGSWPVLAALYPELEALPVHSGRRRRYLPIAQQRNGPDGGLPVKSIVFPRYQPNQPIVIGRLTPLQVLERLTRARSWMSLDGRRFAATLRWIEATPGYELSHASLEEGVLALTGLLRGERTGLGP
jgi:hypothetical protein